MQNIQKILKLLKENEVEFVVIGGYAAIVHGASCVTEDLDLCIAFEKGNLEKMLKAFSNLHPEHRLVGKTSPITETAEKLSAFKNLYFKTDLGFIDILNEVSGIGAFSEVDKHSVEVPIFDMKCKVLDLDHIIEAKKAMTRSKDKEAVLQLEVIKQKREDSSV